MAEDGSERIYQEKAEAKLTPVERVMTNARYEILSHSDDLKNAGVTGEQLENASVNASNRVKAEFEAKEKDDPIRRIATALHESAQTDPEKEFAEQMDKKMELYRSSFAKSVNFEMRRAKKQGVEFKLEETLNELYKTGQVPQNSYFDKGTNLLILPLIETNTPSGEFVNKVLRNIGAIENDETLSDVALLPSYDRRSNLTKPHYDPEFSMARNMPTNVEGVQVAVNVKDLSVRMMVRDLKTIEKIVDFPTS